MRSVWKWIGWGVGLGFAGAVCLISSAGASVPPRVRLGALPFPGPFTLYASADLSDLGPHRYAGPLDRPPTQADGARGIVYTCRAGFLDLAHLRESVDWTWWLHGHAKTLIGARGGTLAFESDQTGFELIVRPSPEIDALPSGERAAVIEEAALCLAQRAAFIVETWHEIESWYGLRTVFFVPEDRSTFTWDDSTSHAVGIRIGAKVVRGGERDYDRRAAAAIRSELEDLEAVSSGWVDKAAYRVKGRWWTGEVPIRRDLDIGLTTGFKTPWLVQGLECCEGARPIVLEIPSLRDIRGHDLSGMYEIRLTLAPALAASMYKGRTIPTSIDAEREFPVLIERMRGEMKARFGQEVDQP